MTKSYLSTAEAARILHISRVAVFNKIKQGQLEAEKVGRNYIIAKSALDAYRGNAVSEHQKEKINKVVKQAVKEYGAAFRRLGKEE